MQAPKISRIAKRNNPVQDRGSGSHPTYVRGRIDLRRIPMHIRRIERAALEGLKRHMDVKEGATAGNNAGAI